MADAQPSKTCRRCHEVKSLSGFSADKQSSDGKRSYCRLCRAKLYREYRARNPDVVRATQRARPRKRYPQRKKTAAEHKQKNTRYYSKFPEKLAAHRAVGRAVQSGRLVNPGVCSKCGAGGWIQASHSDYSKPLDVEWLCIKCHRIKDAASYKPARH